jgi:hypothetical protein
VTTWCPPPSPLLKNFSLSQLQNYVVGLSRNGIALTAGGSLDIDRTFQRVNYLATCASECLGLVARA